MAYIPPGGLFEIAFSFDTTGSMSSILDEVRGRLQDTIQRLQADIPGIKFAVFAHGDYCDAEHFYVTKHVDFTSDLPELSNFVRDVEGTGGGDTEECYELVLRMARENLSWSPGTQRALVMIGDAYPHEPEYNLNTQNINWRDEVKELSKMGVKIYGVQAFEDGLSTKFFEAIADATGGHYLKLGDFNNICSFMMAICYRERSDDLFHNYETEVRNEAGPSGINKDLEGLFGTLRRGDSDPNPAILKKVPSFSTVTPEKKINDPLPAVVKNKKKVGFKDVDKAPKKESVKKITKKTAKPSGGTAPTKGHKKKHQAKKIRALRRENVSTSHFALCDMKWSSWIPITKGVVVDGKQRTWVKRIPGGGCRRKLFKLPKGKIIIEFAVQVKPGTKRHVVYYSKFDKCLIPKNWEKKLFKDTYIKNRVNSLMKNSDCVVLMRYLCPRRQFQKATKLLDTLYDYAWVKRKSSKSDKSSSCRGIVKHGIQVS